MLPLFKYLFATIYLFYRDILHVRTRTHFFTSFVMALILLANVFVLVNALSILLLDRVILGIRSYSFIYLGNSVMFAVLAAVSFKQRYAIVIHEIQALPNHEKKRLKIIASVYVVLSMLALVPFIR